MYWSLPPFPIRCALIALLSLAGAGAGASESVRPVTCVALPDGLSPGSEPHLNGICAALNARSDLPRGLNLVLVVEVLTDTHVTAHLHWQTPDGPVQGPSVSFGFLDTSLSQDQYEFVVNNLIRATNPL